MFSFANCFISNHKYLTLSKRDIRSISIRNKQIYLLGLMDIFALLLDSQWERNIQLDSYQGGKLSRESLEMVFVLIFFLYYFFFRGMDSVFSKKKKSILELVVPYTRSLRLIPRTLHKIFTTFSSFFDGDREEQPLQQLL